MQCLWIYQLIIEGGDSGVIDGQCNVVEIVLLCGIEDIWCEISVN